MCCIINKLSARQHEASKRMEKSRSWPSAHDWKSCIPQKGIEGSNPSFSAKLNLSEFSEGFFFCSMSFFLTGGSFLGYNRANEKPKREDDSMLNIFFGDMPEAIYNTEVYFKNTYQDQWLEDDFAKRVIEKVDKSQVLDTHLIKSPVLGLIPPVMLSGGTKTLLLIKNNPDLVFNASTCGDNCARFILELARQRDVTINLRHIMRFGKRFKATVLNDGVVVDNMEQLIIHAGKYV